MDYYTKYIKYKNKYILEKKKLLMKGGSSTGNKVSLYNLPGVDSENGHIKHYIQNLILMFGGKKISFAGIELYKNDILVQELAEKSNNTSSGTQSFLWVPLIWNALAQDEKIKERIPDNWIKLSSELNNHEMIKKAAKELFQIPNWTQYAMFLLNKKDIKEVPSIFDNLITIQESNRLQDIFLKKIATEESKIFEEQKSDNIPITNQPLPLEWE